MQRSSITLIKNINQSLRPSDIQENVESFKTFKEYFYEFKDIIDELNLSDPATEYFSTWVQKSTTFQLNQFADKNKLFLHLLCYIKHQFYIRHDVLIDIFLKSVRSAINSANKKLNRVEKENRQERNKAIKKLSASNKNSRELIEKITDTINAPTLSTSGKLLEIESLVNYYHEQHGRIEIQKLITLEVSLDKISQNQTFFDALEAISLKLQRKVSSITKILEFNDTNSDANLIIAINNFKLSDADVRDNPPLDFLNADENNVIYFSGKLRVSLYKILLFTHMDTAIKSGHLNLLYSYRYKAIHEYLIDEASWKSRRKELLARAGLTEFDDFYVTINKLKQQLENKYQNVNEHFLKNENHYLSLDVKGKIKIATPKTDSDDSEYISSLLSKAGFIPILKILTDINRVTSFINNFKHFSVRHKKMNPQQEIIFAGLMGRGCNVGINRIANISIGINEDVLKNVVNWCFSLKNIEAANNKIIAMISKLSLANHYRKNKGQLHTGSDGRKVNVAVDSLLSSFSFKYFGKEKGVTIYTFVDERQLLFHSTVISASEREAAYVIDGLLQNDVVRSNIHSTDTHGYTETVFSAMHFIETAFAPRIKNIGKQKVYSFSSKQTYENRGYKILPSRIINLKLIEKYWDDILRFMATITLKHTSASQLFKRLSSYAKDHPLYQALKEFGRIIKSIFILTYFDDVELRQRIEKQLNKGELSNKFSKAVFFANNQEFTQGLKEEQEITAACTVLIQNSIVLWNYLYLSQLLTNTTPLERSRMADAIKRGSVTAWGHINMQGEYDFTKHSTNDAGFDMEKILALKTA